MKRYIDIKEDISGTYLVIMVRNAELGKAKTRLAQSVGNEKALEVYLELLKHTAKVTSEVRCNRVVFYSDYIDENDSFENFIFEKTIQTGTELGEKMTNAFTKIFARNAQKVIIIGSDCYELSAKIIENALELLNNFDIVLGPSEDGGYYLLGMKSFRPELFTKKEWSTENVLLDTMLDLKQLNLSYKLLPTLSDVDFVEDIKGDLRKIIEK